MIEVCLATSRQNGGLITIEELRKKVLLSRSACRSKEEEITVDDVLRSINKISILGSGIQVLKSNKSYIVQSVPKELSMDHTELVKLAQSKKGYIHKAMVLNELKWEENRFIKVINDMIMEGLLWLDKQLPDKMTYYWFPGLFTGISDN